MESQSKSIRMMMLLLAIESKKAVPKLLEFAKKKKKSKNRQESIKNITISKRTKEILEPLND